ncbi:PASTA domain-containing protein [Paenibacillus sp. 1001270B_150601_E10]|uniref:PASTA domain-containing protein n=1 Tax=Paenibacillus sp. 1001270B_150601_E10 TaxID=2787079 RepID=UPI00189CE9DD|nr:PASTA domain-containing protein [Paenibacillus sp. 1001270B_150601_E10]
MDYPVIANRYELYKMIMKSDEGTWWRARDNSLKREIILLQLQEEGQAETLKSLGSDAVQVSSESFFQVLNAGTDGKTSYVVFSPQTGMPLYQYAENHAMPLQSALEIVFTAGQRLQEGVRQGLPAFSVSFDNLWITEKHELLVMNYWTEARSSRTGTFGLSQLLYQLCTLHPLAPRQYDTYVSRMQSALKYELATQRSSVMALSKRVYQGNEPVLSYMSTIKEIINQPNIPIAGVSEPEPAPVQQVPEVPAYPTYTAPEPEVNRYSTPAEPALSVPSRGFDSQQMEEEEKGEEYAPPVDERRPRTDRNRTVEQPSPSSANSKKIKRISIIAGVILFFGLLAGAVIWANQLSSSRGAEAPTDISTEQPDQNGSDQQDNAEEPTTPEDQNASTTDGSDSTQAPQDQNQDQGSSNTGTEQPSTGSDDSTSTGSNSSNNGSNTSNNGNDNTGNATSPGNNNENTTPPATTDPNQPVEPTNPTTPEQPNQPGTELPAVEEGQAPNLVGLSREDAEKQALAAGLKYSFVIEASEGGTKGTVFKQEPAAGTPVKKGDKITFTVVR